MLLSAIACILATLSPGVRGLEIALTDMVSARPTPLRCSWGIPVLVQSGTHSFLLDAGEGPERLTLTLDDDFPAYFAGGDKTTSLVVNGSLSVPFTVGHQGWPCVWGFLRLQKQNKVSYKAIAIECEEPWFLRLSPTLLLLLLAVFPLSLFIGVRQPRGLPLNVGPGLVLLIWSVDLLLQLAIVTPYFNYVQSAVVSLLLLTAGGLAIKLVAQVGWPPIARKLTILLLLVGSLSATAAQWAWLADPSLPADWMPLQDSLFLFLLFVFAAHFKLRSLKEGCLMLTGIFIGSCIYEVALQLSELESTDILKLINCYSSPLQLQLPGLSPNNKQRCTWVSLAELLVPALVLGFTLRVDHFRAGKVYTKVACLCLLLALLISAIEEELLGTSHSIGLTCCPLLLSALVLTAQLRGEKRQLWGGQFFDPLLDCARESLEENDQI